MGVCILGRMCSRWLGRMNVVVFFSCVLCVVVINKCCVSVLVLLGLLSISFSKLVLSVVCCVFLVRFFIWLM